MCSRINLGSAFLLAGYMAVGQLWAAPLANSPWPCRSANAQHTARSTAAVLPPNVRTNLYWLGVACVVTLPTNATTSGVVVDESGNLFVGCGSNLLSYAVQGTTNLTLRWNCDLPSGYNVFANVPAVDNAGACYVTCKTATAPSHFFQCVKVNAGGTLAWNKDYDSEYNHDVCPTILADGTIVFGLGKTRYYYRFNDDGTYSTTYQYSTTWTNGTSCCNNAVSQGVGDYTNRLFAHPSYFSSFKAVAYAWQLDPGVNPSTVLWRYVPPNSVNGGNFATPIVGTNNMLYCVDYTYARKLNGTLNGGDVITAEWDVALGDAYRSYFGALSADETTLYLSGCYNNPTTFWALNTMTGSVKWMQTVTRNPGPPAIDSSGYIYFAASNKLYCVQDTGASAQIVQTLDLSAYVSTFGVYSHPCLVDGGIYLLNGNKLLWIRRQALPAGTIFTVW